MTDGKWTCSDHEERWTCGEEFDTREQALAYALGDYADEQGAERVWVGQIVKVTPEDLGTAAARAEAVEDDIAEWLHDRIGEDFADAFSCTVEQCDDLDEKLALTIRDWIVAHDLLPDVWRLERVSSHVVERAESHHG